MFSEKCAKKNRTYDLSQKFFSEKFCYIDHKINNFSLIIRKNRTILN